MPVLPAERWLSIDLYRDNLVKGFAEHASNLKVSVQRHDPRADLSWARRQFAFHVTLPRAVRRQLGGAAPPIVHLLDQNYAYFCRPGIVRRPFRSVVTCHDLAPLRQQSLPALTLRRYRYRVQGLKYADAIICDSAHTRADIVELLDIDPARIEVNPHGVDSIFRPISPDAAARQIEQLLGIVKRGPWVLHVGSNDPRKNMGTLADSLGRLGDTVTPVKIGPVCAALGERAIQPGFVDQTTLVAFYSLADIVVMPSTYEGFGRPVLEAMACGTPVVAAAATSLPEVAGDAALYHPPGDPAALADAIRLLLDDADLRYRLIDAGFRRAAGFTWAAHIERLLAIYARLSNR